MTATATAVRRGLYGVLAGGMLTAGFLVAMPAAQSAPDACSSANQAQILSDVSQNVANYLANHPDVNQALTDISHQPAAEADNNFHGYFLNVNPQAGHDLHGIQAPLAANQQQCGRQMNATDTLGAFQGL
ncbi:MAG TPA: hemophore-related protein [Mycobacterium sp.]|nr:hemophore-related protein [Mycobacterium sp.]